LGVGENRIWMDPSRLEEIASAITRRDVERLIKEGAIRAKPVKGISRGRKRGKERKRGPGSKKGSWGARLPKKERWIRRVRALRKKLRELRDSGKISRSEYRRLYRKVSGGYFRSKAHLEAYLKEREGEGK
ncbi:MAG: 50S ribosomal protein L19e, partial [Candidatus Hadarchaeales archaeon]